MKILMMMISIPTSEKRTRGIVFDFSFALVLVYVAVKEITMNDENVLVNQQ